MVFEQQVPQQALPVIVGIDGSASAVRAAEWAADEAFSRKSPLIMIGVIPAARPAQQVRDARYREAREYLDHAKRAVLKHVSNRGEQRLDVRGEIVRGRPERILTERSRQADLLVVGAAEVKPLAHLLLGSTAVELARTAACPVALIRHSDTKNGPVLIVVEDWLTARSSLTAGFQLAAARGREVVVARIWHGRSWTSPTESYLAHSVVSDRQIEHCRRNRPDLTVRTVTVVGSAVPTIESLAADASIAILTRDRSIEHPDRLGPISRDLARHASCPLLVIPEPSGRMAERSTPTGRVVR